MLSIFNVCIRKVKPLKCNKEKAIKSSREQTRKKIKLNN
jgi:hypothetical protein